MNLKYTEMNNQPVNIPPSTNERVPVSDAPFRHIVPLQIRFNDIDVVGHVNNAVYYQFFDLGKTRYLADVMGDGFTMSGVRAVIVNTECNFYAPTYLGDDIAVLTRTTHIGNRSLRMEQRIVEPQTGVVKCVCTTILAGYDPETKGSSEIPEEYSTRIRAFEQNPRL